MSDDSKRDQQLAELLDSLTAQAERGDAPDLEAIIAAHPDLADELRELWGAVMVAQAVAQYSSEHIEGSDRFSERGHLDDPHATADNSTRDLKPDLTLELPYPLGDYQLLEELGRGGMGIVYRAYQSSLDRTVAVKVVLRGQFANEEQRRRFRAEIESSARLDHPHIVPLYEVGHHDDQAFFSMRYVAGNTLADRLAAGPLPPREAAATLAKVARAVHYAHEQGILHRDLKPANILLDQDGQPFVTDFGLAKQFRGDSSLTASGAILGTPNYMAPEQAEPNRVPLGPTADIYSLGTILYATLTGHPPFQAASPVDTLLMVREQEPPLPRVLNVQADRDLEMIAMKCLQKPPDLRYSDAAALADDLEAYLAGEAIAARSGRFSHVISRMFRETHHAPVLENWGLLWMWHSLVLLVICLVTAALSRQGFDSPIAYLLLWGGGLAVWAPIFWSIRRRAGPVTFVERQIAHTWAASVAAVMLLFVVEWLLKLPVLKLSPVLGLINGMVFIVKAGILAGSFYLHATAMFMTALLMAWLQKEGYSPAVSITLFGVVSALTFFLPGWKYYWQGKN